MAVLFVEGTSVAWDFFVVERTRDLGEERTGDFGPLRGAGVSVLESASRGVGSNIFLGPGVVA